MENFNIFFNKKKNILALVIIMLLFASGSVAYFNFNDVFVAKPTELPSAKNLVIFIDLTENRLYIMKNGEIMKSYPIASGAYDTPSPIGDWQIISKGRWGEGFGGSWMGLNVPWGIYGIHGTSDPYSIGARVSHGCIRMFSRDAAEVYRLVRLKTPVKIYGGPYGPFGMGFRILGPGDRGSDVYEVQKRLKKLGFYNGEPDGIYGEVTKKAVLDFQKKNNMPLTHYLGEKFYHKLNIFLYE